MDIVSRKLYPSASLFRFVVIDGEIQLDEKRLLKGRGFYMQKDLEIIEEAEKKDLLAKFAKVKVDKNFYTKLKEHL